MSDLVGNPEDRFSCIVADVTDLVNSRDMTKDSPCLNLDLLFSYKKIQMQQILMLLSLVTTAPQPRGRAGDSRGSEQGFDKSFAKAVRGKYPGFALYRQKGP